ncbi:MAG: signal peptidase I [Planctomycetes bacterium]|nr:signal peptidase I [Planctomycetota bacterium]
MAPRLMGMHWELRCPSCGYEYSFGSDAEDSLSDGESIPKSACCPNCGMQFSGQNSRPLKVTGGDRVLVLKYVYNFSEPRPFDVIVFKNPQNDRENYIKRLVGLPGETVKVVHGDIFVSTNGRDGPWKIRRKPQAAQEAIWQIVSDGDYQPDAKMMAQKGFNCYPQWKPRAGGQGVRFAESGRVIGYDGKAPAALAFTTSAEAFLPENAYNSRNEQKYSHGEDYRLSDEQARNLCGDLKLSCVFFPGSPDSRLILTISGMDSEFIAELSADGKTVLRCNNPSDPSRIWETRAALASPLRRDRGYKVELCHADLRAWLTIDGKETVSSTDEQYGGRANEDDRIIRLVNSSPQAPALAVSVDGGPCVLRHLAVMRDVYYTDSEVETREIGPYAELIRGLGRPNNWHKISSNGYAGWGTTENPITLRKYADNPDLDEFYVLGDNSPKSKDCRSWTAAAPTLKLFKDGDTNQPIYQLGTVPRYNLLGKAIFVYWPAGYRIPILNLPIIPNVGKMRLIR